MCVADANNHRLQIFSKEQGVAPRIIGGDGPGLEGRGQEPGQVRKPFGAACDGTSLYVADDFNHRVQKLRLADGAHLGTVGKADRTRGDGEGQFSYPMGLCVAADVLYVCDERNHRIVCLGTDLTWHYTFGRRGSGDGEFRYPQAVAAHGGELYAVDHDNSRIQAAPTLRRPAPSPTQTPVARQVFTPDRHGRMRFARAFGGKGDAPGQFDGPCGVAVVRGLVVVSESDNERVQVLTPKGVPLQVTMGTALG